MLPNDPEQLKIAVSMRPVSAAVSARHPLFMFYRRGIITSSDCGEHLDQAVTIVGYGHDEHLEKDYWLIKNSWGSSWGDKGYARIAITQGTGICGINQAASIVFTN